MDLPMRDAWISMYPFKRLKLRLLPAKVDDNYFQLLFLWKSQVFFASSMTTISKSHDFFTLYDNVNWRPNSLQERKEHEKKVHGKVEAIDRCKYHLLA
uniref:Uncharacterized protein n=1 Tax=Peronospora matthiolae TaxID=2874970 RepID=A0AAV1UQN9_9STRA